MDPFDCIDPPPPEPVVHVRIYAQDSLKNFAMGSPMSGRRPAPVSSVRNELRGHHALQCCHCPLDARTGRRPFIPLDQPSFVCLVCMDYRLCVRCESLDPLTFHPEGHVFAKHTLQ